MLGGQLRAVQDNFNSMQNKAMRNNTPFLVAEAMMAEPSTSAGAEPGFEAETIYLTHNSANNRRILDGSSSSPAIPRGRMVKIASSKRRVKSKPPRQEPATIGPKLSSTEIEQCVLESDIMEVIMVNRQNATLPS